MFMAFDMLREWWYNISNHWKQYPRHYKIYVYNEYVYPQNAQLIVSFPLELPCTYIMSWLFSCLWLTSTASPAASTFLLWGLEIVIKIHLRFRQGVTYLNFFIISHLPVRIIKLKYEQNHC